MFDYLCRETDEYLHLQRLSTDLRYFFRHIVVESHFSQPTDWKPSRAFELMADYCVAFLEGDIKRLTISLPPRNGKSLLISCGMPLFEWLTNPSKRFLVVAHHDDLLKQFLGTRRGIVAQHDYQRCMRWVTEVDNEKKTQNDKMGHILSMPSEYIVTGLGGDLIIIDDPISAKNARSLAHCDKVWESITGTLFSRLDNKQKGGILAVSQRVSEADVIGRLQDTGQYVNVVIPAIATQDSTYIFPRSGETWYRKTGDILNPDLEPIEVLQEIREYNEGAFLCQYQQQPLVQGNGVISFQSISTFTQAENNYEKIILSADTASSVSKSAANWALGVFGLWTKNGKKCLDVLHCHANQYEYPQGKRKVEELIETYNVDEVLVENKSTGTALIPQLKEAGYNVISIKVTKSKEERAMSCSSFINSGRLRLPCREAMPWTEAWTPLFRYEIQGFPHAKTRDVLDCTTQVINHYQGQRVDLRRFYGL